MTFQVPWVISDVNEIPLNVARLLAYISTSAREGIIEPQDLQVRELGVPGSSIRVAPGSFAALNRFPGNSQQTYLGQNDAEVTQGITATGGATRSDLVYVRVNDSGQTGGGVSGAAELKVAEGVSPTATTLQDFDSTIAGVALARIDMPANTSTVSQANIVDLRKLVFPRRIDELRISNLTSAASGVNEDLTSATYVNFPAEASWSIDIPDWAVRAQIVGWLSGYRIVQGDAASGTNVYGKFRISLGTLNTLGVEYNHEASQGLGTVDASATTVGGDVYVPVANRGTTATLVFQGVRDGSNDPASALRATWGTCVVIRVIFYEDPDDQFWQD